MEGGTDRWTVHVIKKTEDHRQRLRALWGGLLGSKEAGGLDRVADLEVKYML